MFISRSHLKREKSPKTEQEKAQKISKNGWDESQLPKLVPPPLGHIVECTGSECKVQSEKLLSSQYTSHQKYYKKLHSGWFSQISSNNEIRLGTTSFRYLYRFIIKVHTS